MATNVYFNNYGFEREQALLEDLIIEALKIYGVDVKYVPRRVIEKDDLFGEAILARFEDAATIEMYVKNVEGFQGDGDFLSKFGLEIRDQITFTVSRRRFDQIKSQKLLTEVGYNVMYEDGTNKRPSRRLLTQSSETETIILEGLDEYQITVNRPQEGDMLYFPFNEKLYEIKFVEHEPVFYPLGRLQTYDIKCELFEYSSEEIDTGYEEIDRVQDNFSLDMQLGIITSEANSEIVDEMGENMLQEYRIENQDARANNELYHANAAAIIDFSEVNPWSEGKY